MYVGTNIVVEALCRRAGNGEEARQRVAGALGHELVDGVVRDLEAAPVVGADGAQARRRAARLHGAGTHEVDGRVVVAPQKTTDHVV